MTSKDRTNLPRASVGLPVVERVEHPSQGDAQPSVPHAGSDLLHRARMQWQFGDWEALANLRWEDIQDNRDRATLALFVACAWQQLGEHEAARLFSEQAQAWGCERRFLVQLMVAGVHNTLARGAAIRGEETRALEHFRSSVVGVDGDARLACQARTVREVTRMGLLSEATRIVEQTVGPIGSGPRLQPLPPNLDSLDPQAWALQCVEAGDLHSAVDERLYDESLEPETKCRLLISLSDQFVRRGDRLTALHFLAVAREISAPLNSSKVEQQILQRLVSLEQPNEALELLVQDSLRNLQLDERARLSICKALEKQRARLRAEGDHGHEVLLAHLRRRFSATQGHGDRRSVMIEIGSTREKVAGQGSTAKLAEFCAANGIHFVTVDMDPHNTRMAAELFKAMDVTFEAIHSEGAKFMHDYVGPMDFVFLDAYDFDHGKHSEIRQSRYEKYLGSTIDEDECHQMHLKCAHAVANKLAPTGLVCIDDTWLDDGHWTAKGTLAVPFLLANGFELVEARNRSALMRRQGAA